MNDSASEADELQELVERLDEIADTPAERDQLREAVQTLGIDGDVFGRVVAGFDRGDLSEALLGSVLFGIPMLVEGGTLEVGAFLAGHPLGIVGTLGFTVVMVVGVLYVSDIQDVRVTRPLFGVLPRRLVGVLGVAFLTALVSMTAWGRVVWEEPVVALAQVSVAFVPMAIGASLSDILPGT